MNYARFITEQVEAIRRDVGNGIAINALSGGVDSSVVTVLAHKALGPRLRTIFVARHDRVHLSASLRCAQMAV